MGSGQFPFLFFIYGYKALEVTTVTDELHKQTQLTISPSPQTGVDPGKVYLARKKYVKHQEKKAASQKTTKLQKLFFRNKKVTHSGFL